MRLASALVWVFLPVLAGVGLYLLKMQVEAQVQHLAQLDEEIADAREAIHVLKAEWSFLNDPVRLRDEAGRLLAMRPVGPGQIVSYDAIPFPEPATNPAAAPADSGPLAKPVPAPDPLAAMIAAVAAEKRSKRP